MRVGKSLRFSLSLLSFSIFLIVLFLAGPPQVWSAGDELVEGARNEGKLVIYHSPNVAGYQVLIKTFREKYPFLSVESFRYPENKLLLRVLAEERAKKGTADLIDTRGFGINIMKEKGLLMKYRSPNFKFIPREFIDPEGYYWANCYAVQSFAYNTRLISQQDVPKSYDDLFHPRWMGNLYLDERDYEWYVNMLTIMGREKGLELMKKLSKQKVRFRTGKFLTSTLMAAGELPVMLTASGHVIEQLKEQGAPVQWVPVDPIMGAVGAMGITASSTHKNAAKLFTNFLSSKEGQELLAHSYGKNPTRPDAKHRYPNLDLKEHKLFLSSITVDFTKFEKEFRAMFMLQQ